MHIEITSKPTNVLFVTVAYVSYIPVNYFTINQ